MWQPERCLALPKVHLLQISIINAVLVLICSIIWLVVLLPFVLGPLLTLFLIRKVVDFVVQRSHPTYKPMRGIEAIYAAANDINYSNKSNHSFATMCCTAVIDGQISVEEARRTAERTIFRDRHLPGWPFWKMASKPVKCFWYYYWKPLSQMNLEEYIKPFPSHIRDVNQILNEWLPMRFEGENRSPWDVLIFNPQNGEYSSKTLAFVRSNHAMFDVVGARDILCSILGIDSRFLIYPDVIKVPTWVNVFHLLTVPRMIFNGLTSWLSSRWDSSDTSTAFYNDDCNNGDSFNCWDSVDLSQIKSIKRKLKCSFKEILTCAVGSALRQYMVNSGVKVPQNLSAMLNIHWPHAPHPGNLRIDGTSLVPKFNTGETDFKKRVADFHASLRSEIETGTYKFVYYYSSYINYVLPTFLLASIGSRNIFKAYSVTDMPFIVDQEVSYVGKPLSGVYVNIGLQGVPLTIFAGFITLGSKVYASFTANRAFIQSQENLEKVVGAFKHELDSLDDIDDDRVQNALSGDGAQRVSLCEA